MIRWLLRTIYRAAPTCTLWVPDYLNDTTSFRLWPRWRLTCCQAEELNVGCPARTHVHGRLVYSEEFTTGPLRAKFEMKRKDFERWSKDLYGTPGL